MSEVTEAQVHQAVAEACNAQDYQPVVDRIVIWLSQARRDGGIEALNEAAAAWSRPRGIVPAWLRVMARRWANQRSRP